MFCNFLEKIALLMPFRLHFARFQSYFERKTILKFESQLKKSLTLLQVKTKTRLKFCILGLNFVNDLAQVWEARYIAFCNMFSVK